MKEPERRFRVATVEPPDEDWVTDDPASLDQASPPCHAQVTGWCAELVADVAAAGCRRIATGLIDASQSAIDTLAADRREALLATLEDLIRELPDDTEEFCAPAQKRRRPPAARTRYYPHEKV